MQGRGYLVLASIGVLFILFLGLKEDFQPSGSKGKLAIYRHEHSSDIWFHVEEASTDIWESDTIEEREDVLFDGVHRFIRASHSSRPKLLFLVLTEDESSWGADSWSPSRTFEDFLTMINSTGLDLTSAALGIMTSSQSEYEHYRNVTAGTNLARLTLLLKNEETKNTNFWTSVPREGRHSRAFQTIRRANVALLRNEVMERTLHDERHIVWIDSDIKYLSPGIIQRMIDHSETKPDASIITALCKTAYWPDYDKNAFAGFRPPPASHRVADAKIAQQEADAVHKYVGELVQGTNDDDLIALDSVGGTILYMRASLVHQGLTFSPYYVVGTGWGRDGWDGIETQGLCYVANYLVGGGCWTLGGGFYVEHTSH